MFENEIKKYQALNKLAETNGIVVLGGSDDREIPLCELKQAFELNSKLYNRSISDLSINTASYIYSACVEPLHPETLLLHIGNADLEVFTENPSAFDQAYIQLIQQIKASDPKCNIVIISMKNYHEAANIHDLNKHLKYIAESERCEYVDISSKRVWNPQQTKDIVSFLYSTGFVRPLKKQRPTYDLVKILFCYEPTCIAQS